MNKEAEIKKKFKKECTEFLADNKYREVLAARVGLEKEDAYLLRPIIGQNELTQIITGFSKENFMPGVRKDPYMVDSHDFRYLKSGTYKANLHIHSLYSDGKLTIKPLLRHANAIANRNARLNPNNKAPFIIALTDHDCLLGVQELLTELAKNPLKYENLRIVLGVEISTLCNKLPNQIKELRIHTLMYCIDPFEEELNEFIDEKLRLKFELAKTTCKKLNEGLAPFLHKLGIELTLEEGAKIHEMILKGMDEVKAPLTKYTLSKLMFTYYVDNCPKTMELLDKHGINLKDLSIERPIRNYKMLYKRGFGTFESNYKEGLSLYLKDTIKAQTGIEEDFAHILEEMPEELTTALATAKKICIAAHPNMKEIPAPFSCFEDTIEKFIKKPFGIFGIAHPGRLAVDNIASSWEEFFSNLFETFKKAGKDRSVFVESYYQSYMAKKSFDYQDAIDKAIDKFDLIKSGGLDSHGMTVILRSPYT